MNTPVVCGGTKVHTILLVQDNERSLTSYYIYIYIYIYTQKQTNS